MSVITSLINSIPFGNPAERGFFLYKKIPYSFFRGLEYVQFKQTVQYVSRHSPFYIRKFKELGIDARLVQKPEDLKDFFTTAEDIRQNPEEFVCMKSDTAYETTGTTSKRPKRVYFSRAEVEEAGWAGAVGLWGVGVRPSDRVVSAFDNAFWVSGPVLQASCDVFGCFHIETGRMDPREFYERVQSYGVTVLVGDPSWILRLTEIAEKQSAWPLKLIIAGGENFTEEARRYVESVWKTTLLLSYGQTEAFGAIGMESLDKHGYHLNEFHNFFEIVDRDEKGYGELVYTTLNRRVMPLVRYKSGDITRFLEGPTASGLPGRRIEKLRGRVNEWVATAMGNLAPWMFEPVFSGMEGIGPDWQIVIQKDGHKDFIEFRLEIENTALTLEKARENFFEGVRRELSGAWKMYENGFYQMNVSLHPKDSLRSGRKLLRLVDKRSF